MEFRQVKVELVDTPICTETMLKGVQSDSAGASILFVGSTRKTTGDRQTLRLAYDCYRPMAIKSLEDICHKAVADFGLIACHLTHRLGIVELGESSIVLAISSAHRVASLDAASWIMDAVKKSVPIWKQEHWADGETEWIHQGSKPRGV